MENPQESPNTVEVADPDQVYEAITDVDSPIAEAIAESAEETDATPQEVVDAYLAAAQDMEDDD